MTDETMLAERPREHSGLSDYLREPFNRLRGEVDRIFDEFPPRFPTTNLGIRYLASLPMPALEMRETDKEYHLSVELPGVPGDEVDISVDGDLLIVKGEKKEEREEKERNYTMSERSYGMFERRVTLPADCDVDGIEASSDNGVIAITIPRKESTPEKARKIEISAKS